MVDGAAGSKGRKKNFLKEKIASQIPQLKSHKKLLCLLPKFWEHVAEGICWTAKSISTCLTSWQNQPHKKFLLKMCDTIFSFRIHADGIDLDAAVMESMGSQHTGKSDLLIILTTCSQSLCSTGVLQTNLWFLIVLMVSGYPCNLFAITANY